jgi:hypothetical protein
LPGAADSSSKYRASNRLRDQSESDQPSAHRKPTRALMID